MPDIQVQSLLLCQNAIHDSLTGSFSAIGIFDQIHATSFAKPLFTSFMVMAMYRGGRKGERLELKVVGSNPASKPIGVFSMTITDPDPVAASFFHVKLPGFVIKEPGTTSFELTSDYNGKEVTLAVARLTAIAVPADDHDEPRTLTADA